MFGQYGSSMGDDSLWDEEMEDEMEEAERMVRNGCTMRQIARKRFTSLGQSDIVKLFRKYGRNPEDDSQSPW